MFSTKSSTSLGLPIDIDILSQCSERGKEEILSEQNEQQIPYVLSKC